MMQKRTLFFTTIAASVLAFTALMIGLSKPSQKESRTPTDSELRAQFTAHEATFIALRDLILTDRPKAIQLIPDGPKVHVDKGDWIGLQNPTANELSRVGWNAHLAARYCELMNTAKILRVDRGWSTPRGTVAFTMWTMGNVTNSLTKRIVWSPTELMPLADRDNLPVPDNRSVFRPLAKDWYIQTEHD